MTCGSSLKLASQEHNVRLHSHDVKYGSGSGQQVGQPAESGEGLEIKCGFEISAGSGKGGSL